MPAGLTVSAPAATTLARNETTTFTVTVAATEVATLSTTLQLVSNDGDENPFDIPLTAAVTAAPQYVIIDNGDPAPNYVATVGFHDWNNSGHDGDLQYADTSDVVGDATATWHFADVAPGKYRVSTTWILDGSSRPE